MSLSPQTIVKMFSLAGISAGDVRKAVVDNVRPCPPEYGEAHMYCAVIKVEDADWLSLMLTFAEGEARPPEGLEGRVGFDVCPKCGELLWGFVALGSDAKPSPGPCTMCGKGEGAGS